MADSILIVDGVEQRFTLDPDRSLLEVLREDLAITSAKYACGEGECGACRVLLDDALVPACVTPIADAVGRTVTTAAGLASDVLHPVQRALVEEGAMQCGYCTPGMVVAASALLAANPDPDDAEIRAAMDRNVCRCGTYPRIIRAIHRAAELAAGADVLTARPPADGADGFPRPPVPWDMADAKDVDHFAVLADGVMVVLPPDRVPPHSWSASGGAWIHVGTDGAVTAFTGKVDVGQGNRTSLTQMVAEEAGVPFDQVRLVMGDTDVCPYDQGTFGSLSTPDAGAVLRLVAAAARSVIADGPPSPGTRRVVIADGSESLVPADEWRTAGSPIERIGAVETTTGARRFGSDVVRPGMLYGAALHPPTATATLRSADVTGADEMPGATVVHDRSFVGAYAERPSVARAAIAAVTATWTMPDLPSTPGLADWLRTHPVEARGWGGTSREDVGDVDAALATAAIRVDGTYTAAYIAHVPLEPRVAVAEWDGDRLTVWTGTQRPFGVRQELAAALGIPEEDVRVIVPGTGSGFGGKHRAEAAIEAARLARVAGRPVKVAWTREEEFTSAYVRPAAVIDVAAGLDGDGALLAWSFTNFNAGSAGIGSPYAAPNERIAFQPADSPLDQGSYRALAATVNHFARESHIDDLAHAGHVDPVEFRLRHLTDDRLTDVLTAAADRAGWNTTGGLGIACGVEKDARVATCAEVAIDGSGVPSVRRIVTAFDCGAVINPDNLVNQIEGATVMGLGGALFEAIDIDEGRITNGRLSQYRVPRFSDTPEIEVVLLDRRDEPPAGAGETPIVAVAPAIANAIFAAGGGRRRSLPLLGPQSTA